MRSSAARSSRRSMEGESRCSRVSMRARNATSARGWPAGRLRAHWSPRSTVSVRDDTFRPGSRSFGATAVSHRAHPDHPLIEPSHVSRIVCGRRGFRSHKFSTCSCPSSVENSFDHCCINRCVAASGWSMARNRASASAAWTASSSSSPNLPGHGIGRPAAPPSGARARRRTP
jgi:hypothetical protein